MTSAPDPKLRDLVPPPDGMALVVGMGRSGVAVARFLVERGVRVRICDAKSRESLGELPGGLTSAELRLGGYGTEVLEDCEVVFASPGVPWHSDLLEEARRRGIPVSSEIDLFLRACPAPVVGITGTNGKTTTTALVGAILRRGPRPVVVGGNIGDTVLDRLAEISEREWVVLELSSFQLEAAERPRVHIAVVLNITPDHLDRHGTFEAYVDAKARIVEYLEPSDYAVLNHGDATCRSLAARTAAQVVWFDRESAPPVIPLPGRHNLENVLAAVSVGRLAGIPQADIEAAVAGFEGVEHRLELVGEWGGVRWYNDSKATNPDAARVGLDAFAGLPVVLIAGGYGSGFELDAWLDEVAEATVGVVLIGASAPELEERLRSRGLSPRRVASIDEAVGAADALAPPGAVVLFSPGFKSYDMFRDFEDRGRRFKAAVRELKG